MMQAYQECCSNTQLFQRQRVSCCGICSDSAGDEQWMLNTCGLCDDPGARAAGGAAEDCC